MDFISSLTVIIHIILFINTLLTETLIWPMMTDEGALYNNFYFSVYVLYVFCMILGNFM